MEIAVLAQPTVARMCMMMCNIGRELRTYVNWYNSQDMAINPDTQQHNVCCSEGHSITLPPPHLTSGMRPATTSSTINQEYIVV